MFYDNGMKKELHALWPGGPLYRGDAVNADSLCLAAFASGIPARRACDLGCGSGILMLLLAWGDPALAVEGVELRPGAAEECRENLRRNGLDGRCRVVVGDLRDRPLPDGSVDLVVSNPPFFPAGAGRASPDGDRRLMRTETAVPEELCAAAAALLRSEGSFCLVHRTARLGEILSSLAAAGLTPRRLRMAADAPGRDPEVFFCQAVKGAGGPCVTEPVLYRRDALGRETAEYRSICHWEG